MTTTPNAARVSGTIKALAKAFHDGPLGATDHVFDETDEQGEWCMEVARFFLAAIQPDQEPVSQAAVQPDRNISQICQPEPQPVAWQRQHPDRGWMEVHPEDIEHYRSVGHAIRPLYATPSSAGGRETVTRGKGGR